ncbi:MAG: OmpA family protein [Flavobacteriales bacterium]
MTFPPCVRLLGLLLGLLSCVHGTAQFVVERSPWLDGEAVTEEPVHQTWAVADQSTAQLIQAELTVEGLNPRKPVRLRVDEDTTLKLAPYRRYSRLCVEPDFMLYADYIYADPEIQADTLLLEPLAIGLETALPAIEFIPGTEDLYFTSVPALEALRAFIEVNPTVSVAIIGHEGEGTTEQHRTSRNRARAVFEYLVSSGVNANRLSVEGRGASQRLYPHPATPEEEEANRRISIRVTNY